jgi:glycolate oxidase iron-sulfur subunit
MSVMFGETNAASVRLLNQAGYEVVTPAEQGCCGALYAHGGNLDQARACARHNIQVFEALGLEAIIINAAGCGSALKEYGHLLRDDPVWAARAARFSSLVADLTEWLFRSRSEHGAARVSGGQQAVNTALEHDHLPSAVPKVTYHDACHLAHPQRITRPPRELLRAVAGDQLVDLSESDVCCGSAGSYNLTEPAMAERLQRRKIENILQTGATIVVTTNPGCILQIRAGLLKAGASHIRVLHIADYLVEFGGLALEFGHLAS